MLTREILKETEFGKQMSDSMIDAVIPLLTKNSFTREFQAGDVVRTYGVRENNVMIILKGVVKSYNYTRRGERIFFYYFSKGSTMGLLTLFNPNNIPMAEEIADKDTELLYIPKVNFQEACQMIPAFETTLFRLVCKLAQRQINMTILSRCKYANDRICLYLLHEFQINHSSDIPIHFTIESLANYLGLTRSVLSKELHALEDEGLIRLEKRNIYLINLKGLQDKI